MFGNIVSSSCDELLAPCPTPCSRTTLCWLSTTIQFIYSYHPYLEAIPPSTKWGHTCCGDRGPLNQCNSNFKIAKDIFHPNSSSKIILKPSFIVLFYTVTHIPWGSFSCPFCIASGIYRLFHFLELYLDRNAGGHLYNQDTTVDRASHHQLAALTSTKLVSDRKVSMRLRAVGGRPAFFLGRETTK